MRNRLIEIFEENQQQICEEMAIGASMYGVMADQIIKELEACPVDAIVILRCSKCGEKGHCQSILNPYKKKTEYWVSPKTVGKCKKRINGKVGDHCKTDGFPTERAAIKTWNFEQAKAK